MEKSRREMTPHEKEQVLRLCKAGRRKVDIGNIVGFSSSTVSKFLKNFQLRGSVENKRRTGRPKLTSDQGDRTLFRLIKRDRRQSLCDLTTEFNNSNPVNVSKRTVQRRLHFEGYTRRSVCKTLTISPVNRKKRLEWCYSHRNWTFEQNWKSVIFSDETQVVLGTNHKVYVWRKADEKWRPECLGLRSSRHGSARVSVSFWGCICASGVGILTPIEGNLNTNKYIELLDEFLWPVVAKNFDNQPWIFQDDNCPAHMSAKAQQWKTENNINCLPWPSQSPDINLIENVWRIIKIRLQRVQHNIKTRNDLIETVQQIWMSLTPGYIKALYLTLPRRIQAVKNAKGHATKY